WKIFWKFSTVTSSPCETSPRSGRVVRKMGGGNTGRKCSGRSKSRSKRSSRTSSLLCLMCICGKTMPPTSWWGCGRGRSPSGDRPFSRIVAGDIFARASHDSTPLGRRRRPHRDRLLALARHHHGLADALRQVVALLQQLALPGHDAGLGGLVLL